MIRDDILKYDLSLEKILDEMPYNLKENLLKRFSLEEIRKVFKEDSKSANSALMAIYYSNYTNYIALYRVLLYTSVNKLSDVLKLDRYYISEIERYCSTETNNFYINTKRKQVLELFGVTLDQVEIKRGKFTLEEFTKELLLELDNFINSDDDYSKELLDITIKYLSFIKDKRVIPKLDSVDLKEVCSEIKEDLLNKNNCKFKLKFLADSLNRKRKLRIAQENMENMRKNI